MSFRRSPAFSIPSEGPVPAVTDYCARDREKSASAELTIRVVRSLQVLEEFRHTWSAWCHHPNADIDFYSLILRSRPEILQPWVLVCYRGQRPDAMLIGRIENSFLDFRLGYKTLSHKPARQLTLVHGGALGNLAADNCAALIREVTHTLQQGEAEVAFFNHLRMDSQLYTAAIDLPGFLSRDRVRPIAVHRSMTLPSSIEAMYRGLSPKVRKNLKWQAKKIVSDFAGDIRVRTIRHTTELEELIRDVEHIARRTYQRGLGVGFVNNEAMRQRLRLESKSGWLRANVLYIKGNPCAFWIGSLYGNVFHSNFMGYDSDYAQHSPGMYLIMRVIEDLIGNNSGPQAAQIDFGLGDAQYKSVLGDHQWQETSMYIFAPTLRGVGFNALRTSVGLMDEATKRILERSKLLQKVKKIWRTRARRQVETLFRQ